MFIQDRRYILNTEKPELLLRELITCSIVLEKMISDLYFELYEKTRDPDIKLLFRVIGLESKRHSEILEETAVTYGLKQERVDCRKHLGELFVVVESVLNQLREKSELTLKDLETILGKNCILENFVGEETYHRILLPLLVDMVPDASESLVRIMNKIVRDEEFHEEALKYIISRIRTSQ